MPNVPLLSRHEIAEIAHELRSPLGGFEAMLELLARTPLSAEQQRLVQALEASASHLRGILARVLPAHQGEGGDPLALGPLLGAIGASAAARAAARGLGFECRIDPDVDRTADVEAVALRQVLENLIDNAIRATSAGAIRLEVTRGSAGRIAFSLDDEGPGLDPAEAQRLMGLAGEGVLAGSGCRSRLALSPGEVVPSSPRCVPEGMVRGSGSIGRSRRYQREKQEGACWWWMITRLRAW